MTQTTLITVGDLRGRFDIDADLFPDSRITPNLRSASRRLRQQWAGDVIYDAALVQVNTDPVPEDATLWELQNVEAHLAMHYAILGFNSPITSKGVVATAMSTEAKEVRRYLAPKETAELAQSFLDIAFEIWSQVKTTIVSEPMPVEVASLGAGSQEGATRTFWCGPCGVYHPWGFTGSCVPWSWL